MTAATIETTKSKGRSVKEEKEEGKVLIYVPRGRVFHFTRELCRKYGTLWGYMRPHSTSNTGGLSPGYLCCCEKEPAASFWTPNKDNGNTKYVWNGPFQRCCRHCGVDLLSRLCEEEPSVPVAKKYDFLHQNRAGFACETPLVHFGYACPKCGVGRAGGKTHCPTCNVCTNCGWSPRDIKE